VTTVAHRDVTPAGTAGPAPTVVVAMDKLKGSVTARAACDALATGLRRGLPAARVITVPIADGGDGSVAALVETGHRPLTVDVVGPTGLPHRAIIALSGEEAFVELASTCGINLLPGGVLNPLHSGSRGLGLALRAALAAGARRIGIGLGGSASTDGGLGMLQALGARVLDVRGSDCSPDTEGLLSVASIDVGGLDPRVHEVDWFVACDVDVPLLGAHGAARMFGPQKGLVGDTLRAVEASMAHWADLVEGATGRPSRGAPGAGAAGGVGFAAVAGLGARTRSGSEYLLEALGLQRHVDTADLVVTGEGRWDDQTERGKGPGAVLDLALRSGAAAAVVAGSVQPGLLEGRGLLAVQQLTDLEPDTSRAMRDALLLLRTAGERLGRHWPSRSAPTHREGHAMTTTPATTIPRMVLNDGRTMPQVGFGVFKVTPDQAGEAVRSALEAGYRHFDLAAFYENEAVIGAALRTSGIPREDLFITSKLWNDCHGRQRAVLAYEASLQRIGVDWLDLYMIHWPAPLHDRYAETWQVLAELRAAGRVASIGTSNFLPEHLDRLEAEVGVVPAVNQVELHPYFQQPAQRAYHTAHGIVTEAWSPLGRGAALADPVLAGLAREHGVSPARIVLRWHLQLGHSVIPKSGHPDRIADNIRLFDFTLTETDLAAIAALDRGERGGPDPLTVT